jgi:hypothetical protein
MSTAVADLTAVSVSFTNNSNNSTLQTQVETAPAKSETLLCQRLIWCCSSMRHGLCTTCMRKQCQQQADCRCHMRDANKSRPRRSCSNAQAALLCALFASSWCCGGASTSSECVRRSPHFVAPAQRSILCGNSTSTTPAECAR